MEGQYALYFVIRRVLHTKCSLTLNVVVPLVLKVTPRTTDARFRVRRICRDNTSGDVTIHDSMNR